MLSPFVAGCPCILLKESMIGESRTSLLEWSKEKLDKLTGGTPKQKIELVQPSKEKGWWESTGSTVWPK